MRPERVTPASPLDLGDASTLALSIDGYGGAPGNTGYEAVGAVT